MPDSSLSAAATTVAAGAIVLLLYLFIHARLRKAYTRRSPVAGTSPAYKTTYRAQGIPATFDRSSTRELLRRLLQLDDEGLRLTLLSLAPSPYEPKDKASHVATFTFNGISRNLPATRKEWTFTLPSDEEANSDRQSRTVKLTIDSHFEGFTPLNAFENGEDHVIE